MTATVHRVGAVTIVPLMWTIVQHCHAKAAVIVQILSVVITARAAKDGQEQTASLRLMNAAVLRVRMPHLALTFWVHTHANAAKDGLARIVRMKLIRVGHSRVCKTLHA
jgi:hypothetical protein